MPIPRIARSPLLSLLLALVALGGVIACSDDDPKLKVTDLSPITGDTEGGTFVVIKGNRFLKDGPRNAKVYFGSRQAQIIRWQSDSELIVQAPPGKPDEVVDVLVIFDPGGQLTLKKVFKYIERDDSLPSIDQIEVGKGKSKK
jgi:hypothetical protein